MRVPLEWLHEYCRPELSPEALGERLDMTGTAVERIEHHGVGALENFVVGKVLAAEQHPDADRLRVCQVDTGTGQTSQIVCGAPNVAAGQTVAVAQPGAIMPDGTKLKTARLRGQESHGMILAEDELAIGTDHDGIIVLEAPSSTSALRNQMRISKPGSYFFAAGGGLGYGLSAAIGGQLAPPTRDESAQGFLSHGQHSPVDRNQRFRIGKETL